MNKFEVKNMDLYYGSFHALKDINISIESHPKGYMMTAGNVHHISTAPKRE